MGILKKYPTHQSVRRVICPECHGEGEAMYYNEKEHLNELGRCHTCGGVGMVVRYVELTYKKLNKNG